MDRIISTVIKILFKETTRMVIGNWYVNKKIITTRELYKEFKRTGMNLNSFT